MIAEQLKKAVLQAAIQGKLTEQLPEDGDARELLEEIKVEKERLIKEGKLKKEDSFADITEDEIPFDIPANWCWVRLGQIADYKKGPFGSSLTKSMFIPDGKNSIKVYEQKNAIQQGHSLGCYFIPKSYYESSMRGFTVVNGDIIISCAGTIGSSYILPSNARLGIINQALMRTRTYSGINKHYFLQLFDFAINSKEAKGKGSAIKNIPPFKVLKNIIVPLPPLLEQGRILKTVDEILCEIGKLNDDEAKLDALQQSFPGQMKSSILQAAIQGKLTEQLPEDGDASELLKEIRVEKERLIKEGKIKKEKPLPEITDDEIPFDIPENWCWVTLDEVINLIMGQSPDGSSIGDIGVEFHQGKQAFGKKVIKNSNRFCSTPKKIAEQNSILLCVRAPVGKVNLTNRKICIGRGLAALSPILINIHYLFHLLLVFEDYFIKLSTGSTFKAISKDIIRKTIIPLPPLDEQRRIIARLEELLPLCDALEL